MHFKQDSVARKTNCFQEANIFVKPCGMRGGGGRWERGAPRPWLSIGPRTLLIRLRLSERQFLQGSINSPFYHLKTEALSLKRKRNIEHGYNYESRTRDSRTCYVSLSVSPSVTKTKRELFLAIPLMPTRPRLGGVYTDLFI